MSYDLLVIGAGPGGYVAAIRAAQLGLSVACVDKNQELGGTCLRVGCIPSKAMLESSEQFEHAQNGLGAHGVKVSGVELDLDRMLQRKRKVVQTLTRGVATLFKKNRIERIRGTATIEGPGKVRVERGKGETQTVTADRIIIATGSRPASLPGIDFRQDRVDTSTDALAYDEVPGKLAVIGAGYIGIELGSVWRRLGAQVTMLEYLDRILPGMDSETAETAHKLLKKQGLEFRLGSRVTGVKATGHGVKIAIEGGDDVEADRVLVAVGRAPFLDGLGLEEAGVKLDDRGRVVVDENYATSVKGIYAIGDVIPGPMLAHKASEEGVACVEKIVSGVAHVNYDAIPAVVFTHPEIASVGRTEDQLREDNVDYRRGEFPFLANGRARSLDDTAGRVKVLADSKTDRVLGVHIIGPGAGELIAECTAAMDFGATAEDIARVCHTHPTLSEAVKEAALGVAGRTIHI